MTIKKKITVSVAPGAFDNLQGNDVKIFQDFLNKLEAGAATIDENSTEEDLLNMFADLGVTEISELGPCLEEEGLLVRVQNTVH